MTLCCSPVVRKREGSCLGTRLLDLKLQTMIICPLAALGRSLVARAKGQSAHLLDGDGPAAPNAVHFTLGSFLLPVQVSTFSRLKEKRTGMLEVWGLFGEYCPPEVLTLPFSSLSWAALTLGPAWAAGREGTETRVFQWVYSYTRHHTEQHRSLSQARPSQRART